MNRLLHVMEQVSPVRLLVLLVVLSIVVATAIVSGMSLLFYGVVHADYLVTGWVTALVTATAVLALVLRLLERLREHRTTIQQHLEERQRGEQALRESEARYRTLFDCAPDAIFLVDPATGLVLDANATATRLLGMPRTDIVGLHQGQLHPPEISGSLRNIVDTYTRQAHGVQTPYETAVIQRTGTRVPVEVVMHRVALHGRSVLQGVFRDISERKRQAESLRRAQELAEIANRAKTDFLFRMGHEIRTPMNIVNGMAELLLETVLTTGQKEMVQRLRQSAGVLVKLLNQILELANLESCQTFSIVAQPVDIRAVMAEAVETFQVLAEDRGVQMTVQVSDSVPAWIWMDGVRLHQVLFHVLGNAVKFTTEGTICCHVDVDAVSTDLLHLTVRDTGIGMTPEQIGQIGQLFGATCCHDPAHVTTGLTRRYGGAGLGLSIARRLLEWMGGRIDVESTIGAGSTFHVRLPLRASAAPYDVQQQEKNLHSMTTAMAAATGQTVAAAPDVTGNAELRPLRILSVDDSPDNQLLIGSFLKRTPHTVLYAAHGLEAIGLVQGQDPDGQLPVDLILMDVQMPVMDGYTATRQLRQWEQEQGRLPVPIIAVTAHALESDAARSIAAGCNVHLTKPVTRQRLLETIREVMRVAQPGGDDAVCA